MNQRNPFVFWLSLLGFLIFGAISCWATQESLFLSFSGGAAFPHIVWWIIVVGLYVVTAIGTKMIVDSFNTEEYVDHRRLKLLGGVLIVIACWLLVSLPTNAHTFLYKRANKTVAHKEISWQQGELAALTDTVAYQATILADFNKQMEKVDQLEAALVAEIGHPERPGAGDNVEQILQDIERTLGVTVGTIPRTTLATRNANKKEINRVTQYYSNAIKSQKEVAEASQIARSATYLQQFKANIAEVKRTMAQLDAVNAALDDDSQSSEEVLIEARKQINNAYDVIDRHQVVDKTSARERYVTEKHGMPSSRLINVVEIVYKDYLGGHLSEYDIPETKGMIYFVLIAILIDLSAFVFFNIAFKK